MRDGAWDEVEPAPNHRFDYGRHRFGSQNGFGSAIGRSEWNGPNRGGRGGYTRDGRGTAVLALVEVEEPEVVRTVAVLDMPMCSVVVVVAAVGEAPWVPVKLEILDRT